MSKQMRRLVHSGSAPARMKEPTVEMKPERNALNGNEPNTTQ